MDVIIKMFSSLSELKIFSMKDSVGNLLYNKNTENFVSKDSSGELKLQTFGTKLNTFNHSQV